MESANRKFWNEEKYLKIKTIVLTGENRRDNEGR